MTTEYKGNSLVVEFNTVDVSGQARTVTVNEEAGEPDEIDITHKGDSERQTLEGLPGSPKTSVNLETLDYDADTVGILTFALNAKDTLLVYPRGKTHGYPKLIINNARLISREKKVPYDGAAELTSKFSASNTVTYSTYSSV